MPEESGPWGGTLQVGSEETEGQCAVCPPFSPQRCSTWVLWSRMHFWGIALSFMDPLQWFFRKLLVTCGISLES